MKLYHFCCDHSVDGIIRDGAVIPQKIAAMPGVSWFTDLEAPTRETVGLTNNWSACDKLEFRFEVVDDHDKIQRWVDFVRENNVHPDFREALESAPGAMPMHWFVSTVPVNVVRLP